MRKGENDLQRFGKALKSFRELGYFAPETFVCVCHLPAENEKECGTSPVIEDCQFSLYPEAPSICPTCGRSSLPPGLERAVILEEPLIVDAAGNFHEAVIVIWFGDVDEVCRVLLAHGF